MSLFSLNLARAGTGRPWSVGLGQDNINVLLPIGHRWAYQGRLGGMPASGGQGVFFLGSSLRRYFPKTPALDLYASADTNGSYFDVDQAEGTGVTLGANAGVEYRLRARLSLSVDIGPYWIYLRNFEPLLTRQSWGWIINSSVNFYMK
ncbi:MAG: hypothetical protein AAB091_03575 [Elusimicrobiota bacterium]